VIGLIDCNSFYASCERIFRPDLKGRPIVVLSNNDGCIVAQSEEAKKMGIARGAPYHQNREFLREKGAAVFSSNYALYQDISNRVMDTVRRHVPAMEIYSIDEAFLFFEEGQKPKGLERLAGFLKEEVERCTGIPVSIGLGRSKTLAKVAERYSKKRGGVFIMTADREDEILAETQVQSLWGIGRRKAETLTSRGIMTAGDFLKQEDWWVKKNMTVVSLYTLWELRGRPMITAELTPPPRKEIVSGITAKTPIKTRAQMREAMARHAQAAADKLAGEKAVCSLLSVSMNTNRFKENFSHAYKGILLSKPMAYPPDIIKSAIVAMEEVYEPGRPYIRTAVNLGGLEPQSEQRGDLFCPEEERLNDEKKRRMDLAQRKLVSKFGRKMLVCAATGLKGKADMMNRDYLSPRYTTSWEDLPRVIDV
jgi:DNA polymerase V